MVGIGVKKINAVRSMDFYIEVADWGGTDGAWSYNISKSGITENTQCEFEMTSTVLGYLTADIQWTTTSDNIALLTASKPSGTLSGTLVLTEVSPEVAGVG